MTDSQPFRRRYYARIKTYVADKQNVDDGTGRVCDGVVNNQSVGNEVMETDRVGDVVMKTNPVKSK